MTARIIRIISNLPRFLEENSFYDLTQNDQKEIKEWYSAFSNNDNFSGNDALKLMATLYAHEDMDFRSDYFELIKPICNEFNIEYGRFWEMYAQFRQLLWG